MLHLKVNSYKCICNKVMHKNNYVHAFSLLFFSLLVFSKSLQ